MRVGMINFLEEVAPADSVMAKAVADYRAIRSSVGTAYVLHEYLEPFNAPCYFLEFGKRTEPYRLTYLAEQQYRRCMPRITVRRSGAFAPGMRPQPGTGGAIPGFLHQPHVPPDPARARRPRTPNQLQPGSHAFRGMQFAASLPRVDGETRLDNSRQEYGSPGLSTDDPGVKAALDALNGRWPWTLSRREILDLVYERLDSAGIKAAADQEVKVDDLLEILVLGGAARFRLDSLSPAPTRMPLRLDDAIRRMAELARNDGQEHIFNLWHETIWLTPVDLQLLPLLDGTRDRDGLIEELLSRTRDGVVGFARDGQQLSTEAELREAAAEYIDALPQRLTEMKLIRVDEANPGSTDEAHR